jgi:lipopolysaccharide/colanic/teichoic acid biosynthesis glycosyltransferase
MLSSTQQTQKRIFDISISIVMLPFVIIPLILLWILATVSTAQNGWFIQERIGRYGKPFQLFKIRSLKGSNHEDIREMEAKKTLVGHWLRSTKLDELPQLFNVLKGDMSLVGPRPDVPGYADLLEGDDRDILTLRPGITGPATLKYKNEDRILLLQHDPTEYNNMVIWPDKVSINKTYLQNWSLKKDIQILIASV